MHSCPKVRGRCAGPAYLLELEGTSVVAPVQIQDFANIAIPDLTPGNWPPDLQVEGAGAQPRIAVALLLGLR